MSDIIINIKEFQCEAPILGQTFRQGGNYIFNWETKGDLYESKGIDVSIKLFYLPEAQLPEQEYTAQVIPYNASSFLVDQLAGYDQVSFRLEFTVDNGDTCYYSIDIPISSIIIT